MAIIEHAQRPQFCAACERFLIENLPAGRVDHSGYCPHHSTLAQVRIEPNGRIRSWRLMAPVSEEQAGFIVECAASMREEIFSRERAGKKNH